MKISYYNFGIVITPISIILFFSTIVYIFDKECIFPSYAIAGIVLSLLLGIILGLHFITEKHSDIKAIMRLGKPKVYIIGNTHNEYKVYSKTWLFNSHLELSNWISLEKAIETKERE